MNSKPEQPESQSGEIEFSSFDELSAYLDGELDEKQTQEVEKPIGKRFKIPSRIAVFAKNMGFT